MSSCPIYAEFNGSAVAATRENIARRVGVRIYHLSLAIQHHAHLRAPKK